MQKISSKSLYSLRSLRYFSSREKLAFQDPNHCRVVLFGAGYSGLQAASYIPRLSSVGKYHLKAFDRQSYANFTPGYDVVPFGLKVQEELQKPILQVINDTVNIDFNGILSINPEKSKFKSLDNREYSYDYLVVSAGLVPSLQKVKGLSEALTARDSGVLSTHDYESALKAKGEIDYFQGGDVIFYNSGRSKVLYASLNLSFLFEEFVRKERGTGFRNMTNISYVTDQRTVFPHIKHSIRIQELFHQKNINCDETSLELVEVDHNAKQATFVNLQTKERVVKKFSLLFVNPEHELPEFLNPLRNSSTNDLDIDPTTLAHKKYGNIFAVGHCARTPGYVTTPRGINQQAAVAAVNLDTLLRANANKSEPRYNKYSGNSIVPLFVGDKKLMKLEIDPTRIENVEDASAMAYYKELYLEPSLYFKLITQGVYFSETGFRKPSFSVSS